MICFRVSEDEYSGLKNLCVNEGARSVSDMARDAVNRLIANQSWQKKPLETVIAGLHGRMEALDLEVKRLATALNGQAPIRGVAARNINGDN